MIGDVIRVGEPADLDPIVDTVVESGLFPEGETGPIRALLAEHLAGPCASNAQVVVDTEDDVVVGVAYYQPKAATDGTWDLTMLAVRGHFQGAGRGAALLERVENDVRSRAGRLLLIETSASSGQGRARRLYARAGYDEAATIDDYWEPGDSLVLFAKHL